MNASGEEGMRVALITGAGRGWGERLARELAARGFHIVANDIHPAAAERTAERIRTAGGSAEPFHADVANRVAVGAMVQEILDRWGRLDLVIHHAEVHPHRGLLEMGEYEWDRTVAVILKGLSICCRPPPRR
jgi:NAD(P)-dependent dehydrogenase (short-subunit alcohol dehydrogenase family)